MKSLIICLSIIILSIPNLPALSNTTGKPREGFPGRRVGSGTRVVDVNTSTLDHMIKRTCKKKYC